VDFEAMATKETRRDVVFISTLIWWDPCNTVAVAISFLLALIAHPNGWKQFPCLTRPCQHVLISSWISRFGVPEMITSDHGTHTSNIWSKLCEMLYISHRQTTAYHPESSGALVLAVLG
jgi:hypothetical protein